MKTYIIYPRVIKNAPKHKAYSLTGGFLKRWKNSQLSLKECFDGITLKFNSDNPRLFRNYGLQED